MYITVITCEPLAGKSSLFRSQIEQVRQSIADMPGVLSSDSFITEGGQLVAVLNLEDEAVNRELFVDENGPFHTLVRDLNLSATGRLVRTLSGDSTAVATRERASVR
ncbi:MAG: hypothetical protein IH944_04530 [Armatimonadetes bacterium]|nr:hypothetical protein [Armatimonadota bacterium]